jgi:hypothetical protein
MVCIRPKDIDYPYVEAGEELGFLHKLNMAQYKIISMDYPSLMCQLIGLRHPISPKYSSDIVMTDELKDFLTNLS